ncbi:TPM domain-containing protein [Lichenihabitans psoromatis]|uniref:TPM domain-containing protein n=1 Tax=Lichenihabitans psoromatis TaxID=2528642 RepID=UPI0010364CD5|nr:TPM domain-containing protein [Lichenihabitans psoromatis]
MLSAILVWLALFIGWVVVATLPALAADAYPALTGRVVDNANVIPPASRDALDAKLKALEDKSGIQVVVATVPSLGGNEIEPYANGLFRAWKLGEQKKNNGVLLLVAPTEHKVRIEVGYGLEGTLTDALSKIIITNAMVPRFKTNDYAGGIDRGTDDIITVLTTDSAEWQKRPELRAQEQGSTLDELMPFLVMGVFVIVIVYLNRQTGLRAGGRGGRGGIVFLPTGGSGWGGGFGGGGFGGGDGGGFSGGGGSSGGGGASGGW